MDASLTSRRLLACVATLLSAATAIVLASLPRAAQAATCPPPPDSVTPFLQWQDSHDYVLTTGGSFELGAPAWSLSGGATIVSDRAPDPLAPSTDSRALSLPGGSTVTSACVTAPKIVGVVRFFAKSVGTSGGQLKVEILVKGGVYQAGSIGAGGEWAPTPFLVSDAPAYKGAVTYQVRLTATGAGAAFVVDDVYFDPFHSR